MVHTLPSFPDEISIGPAFYMPDIDGISDVRKFLEEKTDAQCNFAGCGKRHPATKKIENTPISIWEEGNTNNTPNVPTTDGLPLETDFSNAINCYICGFLIDGRRGVALDIQNTWGGQCEHVMAVAALASLCGLAGDNYEKIVKKFLKDCNINGEEYIEWRNRLVKQGPIKVGTSHKNNNVEGGGPTGILYKWAHPGCNEIKGNNPYLRIDFKAIAKNEGDWFTDLVDASKLSFTGGSMKGGAPKDIYCDDVIKWNLACMCGDNKDEKVGKGKVPDGGKKSMYWRKRYKLYKNGIKNMSLEDGVKPLLGKILEASKEFYGAKNKQEKSKAAAALKILQRDLIKKDDKLPTIKLLEKGVEQKEEEPSDWIKKRLNVIKSEVLKPIVQNIVKGNKGQQLRGAELRKFICISQCILTRIFEENLTITVGKLEPDNLDNWSYAPAGEMSSDIINEAFEEIETDGNKNFKIIYKKYKDRLKNIPRTVKALKTKIKDDITKGIKKAKVAVKKKQTAVKKAVAKTGARIKKALPKKKPKKKTGGSQKTTKKGGCRTRKKERKRKTIKRKTIKRSRLYGGNRELIPYRMAIFTSENVKMKSILQGRRFRIYREYLAPYSRITEFGESRIMRWLSLLLSDLDIEDDLLNNYSFELKLMEGQPYPLICTINVLCEKIQTEPAGRGDAPTEIEDNLLLELYNKGKIFKEDDDIYNLGMYKYLTALTLSDRIPSLLDELMYTFDLKFYAQLEMRGIDINEDMKGRAPVQEKGSVRLFIKKPDSNEEPVIQYVESTTGSSKRTKKKGKKKNHKKKISGGDPPYKNPSYQGLIASQAVLNLNGTNFLSDYITNSLLKDDGTYRRESVMKDEDGETRYDDGHLKVYEKSFFDIIKTPESTDDYQDDEAYKEISHAKNDGNFDSDPIFKLFNGEGVREIKDRGNEIREKWGKAELQLDERHTRIFYILGMIDYLSGINIYSYDGNGEDPVEKYLEGLGHEKTHPEKTHPIVHGYKEGSIEHESKYSAFVNDRATKLLSSIEGDDCKKLLSYFGMSYGANNDKGDTDDAIYETIEGTESNMVKNIKKFVINVTMVNVMTYPYIRCYVNYDPAYKRYMWIYDPIMDDPIMDDLDDDDYDDGYGRNFCRTTRRYQAVWKDSDIHTSLNPYTFAYEK